VCLQTALARQPTHEINFNIVLSTRTMPMAAIMSESDRHGLRRLLLDRIVALQLEVQTSGDAEARALLEQARDALRAFDAESLRLFNREVSGGR
jgi:hypothetical protein